MFAQVLLKVNMPLSMTLVQTNTSTGTLKDLCAHGVLSHRTAVEQT